MSKRKYHLVSHLGNTGGTALNSFCSQEFTDIFGKQTMHFSPFAGLGERTKQQWFFFNLRIWPELLSLGLCNRATKSLVMVYSCRVRWITTHADSLTRNLWITEVTFQEGQKKVSKNCQRQLYIYITAKWGLELALQTDRILGELWTHPFEDMFIVETLQHVAGR